MAESGNLEQRTFRRMFDYFKGRTPILEHLRREGYSQTFEEWFDKTWERNAKWAINRPPHDSSTGLSTNYPLTTTKLAPGWRDEKESRPAYLEWKNPNKAANPGYRVIEYFPNRSEKNRSYILTGTDRDIIRQILQIEYEGGGAGGEIERMRRGTTIRRKGQPQIVLLFLEPYEDIEPGYRQVEGRISFRIMGKHETSEEDGKKLTEADLKAYAAKIKEQFWIQGGAQYEWKKGRDIAVYHDWEKGYNLQLYVRSKSDGTELITKVLAVQGHTYEDKWAKYSEPLNPNAAYPIIPPTSNIFGKKVRLPRKRPVARLTFRAAKLLIESLPEPIYLVNHEGQILPNFSTIVS